jgi:hypothetical protein
VFVKGTTKSSQISEVQGIDTQLCRDGNRVFSLLEDFYRTRFETVDISEL